MVVIDGPRCMSLISTITPILTCVTPFLRSSQIFTCIKPAILYLFSDWPSDEQILELFRQTGYSIKLLPTLSIFYIWNSFGLHQGLLTLSTLLLSRFIYPWDLQTSGLYFGCARCQLGCYFRIRVTWPSWPLTY